MFDFFIIKKIDVYIMLYVVSYIVNLKVINGFFSYVTYTYLYLPVWNIREKKPTASREKFPLG